jgi:hypothetical protein
MPFLPPIYPQITPKIFAAFPAVLVDSQIPQTARKAGKARKNSHAKVWNNGWSGNLLAILYPYW